MTSMNRSICTVLAAGFVALLLYISASRPAVSEQSDADIRRDAREPAKEQLRVTRPQLSPAAPVVELEDRLAGLERKLEQLSTPVPSGIAAEEPAKPPEFDLGAWMIETIRGDDWDRKRTEQVEAELANALERTPNLSLEDVECSSRFCSGTLSANDGKVAALAELWGLPPFDGEGFTRVDDSGKIAVFFTKPGESLDLLRQQAGARVR